MAYEFKVRNTIKIENVSLQAKRNILSVITVQGSDFFSMSYKNKTLSQVFTKNSTTAGWPASVISYLKTARNLHTDKLIADYLRAQDPMAEFHNLDFMNRKDRISAYHYAGIPPVVSVLVPGFTTDNGDHVEAQKVDMLSSPSLRKTVIIKVEPANLSLVSKLMQRKVDQASIVESDDDSEDEEARLDSVTPVLPEGVSASLPPRSPTGSRGRYFLLNEPKWALAPGPSLIFGAGLRRCHQTKG